jgi:2-polyprenyl-3-methyl-5-hydroxy-6-metoxy-1,4-benzoquinol methylase|tara:strand:+ start:2916 stop:3692 length:777 start_codon:yes stop_codon:yes gene_type:complete
LKINIGDIYREQASKYNFVNKYSSEKILDLTFGKYFDFAKSEILLSKNIKEVWSLDLLNNDRYITVRKLNNEQKIYFEKKPIDELKNMKFNLITSFNTMRVTHNIDSILEILKNYLSDNGTVVISILNNDFLMDSKNSSNLLSISNLKNLLNLTFSDISFFSQGDVIQMKTYSENISSTNSTLVSTKSLVKKNFKKLFKITKMSQIFYLKYILSPYQSYKKFRRERKYKIDPKKYDIIPYSNDHTPISIMVVCKKLIF